MQLRDKLGRFAGWFGIKLPTSAPKLPPAPPISNPITIRGADGVDQTYERFRNASAAAKSNIAEAKAMEWGTLRLVCRTLGVDEPRGILDALDLLKATHPETRKDKIRTQALRVQTVVPQIVAKLQERATELGPVIGAKYIGDERGLKATVADLRFFHANGQMSDFSLKSIVAGQGTTRNIGARSIHRLTDVDAPGRTRDMYQQVLTEISRRDPARGEALTKMRAGERKRALTDDERDLAAVIGQKATAEVARDFAAQWTTLDRDRQKELLMAGLGLRRHEPNLYIAIVNDTDAKIFEPRRVPNLEKVTLAYDPEHPQQVKFMNGDKLLLRMSFNCTNGLGISSMCVRTFLH